MKSIKFITICPGVTDTPLMDFEKFFTKPLFPTMVDEIKSICRNATSQRYDAYLFKILKIKKYFGYFSVSVVGACVIAALDDGENGLTWRCENGRIEKLKIFEYPKF